MFWSLCDLLSCRCAAREVFFDLRRPLHAPLRGAWGAYGAASLLILLTGLGMIASKASGAGLRLGSSILIGVFCHS